MLYCYAQFLIYLSILSLFLWHTTAMIHPIPYYLVQVFHDRLRLMIKSRMSVLLVYHLLKSRILLYH